MNDFWGAYAVLGFFASVATHTLLLSGVDVPHEALIALYLALIPVFIVAVLMHPSCRWEWGGFAASWDDNVPRWLEVVLWVSVAYLLVLWVPLPMRRFSIRPGIDHPHQLVASWIPAVFYIGAFGLRWSARRTLKP